MTCYKVVKVSRGKEEIIFKKNSKRLAEASKDGYKTGFGKKINLKVKKC